MIAKGIEDTAFYGYNRLVALNEVGGDPSRFGVSVAEFHAANRRAPARWPHALSATATHDTKRGEDVRARINVLSEIPIEWRARVGAWQRLNRKLPRDGGRAPVPGRERRIPHLSDPGRRVAHRRRAAARLHGKATRGGQVHTSWINPTPATTRRWPASSTPSSTGAVARSWTTSRTSSFAWPHFGTLNSLAQTLIKITAPGVPDFYQGTELWDLSLVDPDNRRPVDWRRRRRLLAEMQATIAAAGDRAALAQELVKTREDGRVKMYLIREALAFRARRRALFERGDYRPLEVHGAWAEHVCAFARVADGGAALTVIPRLLARRGPDTLPHGHGYWADTWLELPADLAGRYTQRAHRRGAGDHERRRRRRTAAGRPCSPPSRSPLLEHRAA